MSPKWTNKVSGARAMVIMVLYAAGGGGGGGDVTHNGRRAVMLIRDNARNCKTHTHTHKSRSARAKNPLLHWTSAYAPPVLYAFAIPCVHFLSIKQTQLHNADGHTNESKNVGDDRASFPPIGPMAE